jgi:membrane protein implicated in regulation of membrane protease activity
MLNTQSVVVVVALLGGSLAISLNYYVEEKAEHAKTSLELVMQKQALQTYVDAVQVMAKDQQEIQAKFEVADSSWRASRRDLEGLKGREAVVLRKKGLVELKINKAFQKQQDKFACITGDKELC